MKKNLCLILVILCAFNFVNAQDNCSTDWFTNVNACGLEEYVNGYGATVYKTVPDPMLPDLATDYFDCNGNLICHYGGYYPPGYTDGVCADEFNGVLANLSFVQTVVECDPCGAENWYETDEWGKCGLDEYVDEYGFSIYVSTGSPFMADYGTYYYDCYGSVLCYLGSMILGDDSSCNFDTSNLTFVQTVVECNNEIGVVCDTSWLANVSSCGLEEYVNGYGETIYKTVLDPMLPDLATDYFDCNGNLICHYGGYYPPGYTDGVCADEFNGVLADLSFVQTVVECDPCGAENWYETNEWDKCGLDEYVDDYGFTIYVSTGSPFMADYGTYYYDCYGSVLCYLGSMILGDDNSCNFDISNLTFVQTVVECNDEIEIICDTSWFNGNYTCGLDEYVDASGATIYVTTPQSIPGMSDDEPNMYYDCAGNWLCSTNGEILPEWACTGTFLNDLTFVQTIYSCDDYVAPCDDNLFYSLSLRVLYEGAWNGVTLGSPIVSDSYALPTTQPFSNTIYGYEGTEVADTVLTVAADWVLVELTDANGNIYETKAALIDTDGNIKNVNGGDCLAFDNVPSFDAYFVTIHHLGHLSISSSVALSDNSSYDFSIASTQASGLEAMKYINGAWVMFGGDFDENGIVNSLDFNEWYNDSATVGQYLPVDVDGNGLVNNLDYNIWELNRSKVGSAKTDY